jgi:hypothetical protein
VSGLVLCSFLVGAVSGGRTLTGLAAVAFTTPTDAVPRPWAGLPGMTGRRLLAAVAATAAAVLAVRDGRRPAQVLLPALVGALSRGPVDFWRIHGRR